MVSLTTPVCDFGWQAPDFDLPGTDGRRHTLASAKGPRGLLVMFICNHCPYVQAIAPRLVTDSRRLMSAGIGCIAILSNDASEYPEDSFEHMVAQGREWALPFPYVWDGEQTIAKAYGAVCTPDFFGFNADLGSSTGAGWMTRGATRPGPIPAGNWWKPCSRWPARARVRRSRFPASAAPSNGRPRLFPPPGPPLGRGGHRRRA